MTEHHLEPTSATTVDVFSPERPPVLVVEPGDTVVVRSLDAFGYLEPQKYPGHKVPTMFSEFRGHCLTGPIAVRGARPGQVLALHLVSITPGEWGWTTAAAYDNKLNRRLGVAPGAQAWLLWDLDVGKGTGTDDRGHTVTLSPFLGVMGVPPAEPGEHSTIPPRAAGGGNMDCKELVAGTTLYLPVTVPDAMLCLGDGHATQGDGEVCGTAIECPMTTEAVVDLLDEAPVPGIHAVTPAGRITFGFDEDLNVAMGDALDAMVGWMAKLYDLDKTTALALASPTVDLHITQVVNQTWGVHAILPEGAIF